MSDSKEFAKKEEYSNSPERKPAGKTSSDANIYKVSTSDENKVGALFLGDILSERLKQSRQDSKQEFSAQRFQALEEFLQKQKQEPKSIELSSFWLKKELGIGIAKEFKWLSTKAPLPGNLAGLSQLFTGRSFLSARKGEDKTEKEKQSGSELPQDAKAINQENNSPWFSQNQDNQNQGALNQRRDHEAKLKSQEEEIANHLLNEQIYPDRDSFHTLTGAKTESETTMEETSIPEVAYSKKPVFQAMERIHPQDLSGLNQLPLSKARLKQCINNLSNGKVIVLGDLLIDELLEGKPERISREAPVLILEHVDTILIPGGAANTAHNITALGGNCHAIGVCGKDHYAEKLAETLERYNITHALVSDPSRHTTVKTRILSKSHAVIQQLLRLDRISHDKIDQAVELLLTQKLKQVASQYKAIIISDYRAGVITDTIIQACQNVSRESNLLLIVDSQDKFERFQNVTLLTPNQPDAEKAVGYAFDSRKKLEAAGNDLLLLTGAQALLVTCGAEGMVLFRNRQEPFYLPAFNRSEVFDVTGAGDTVIATMTLALVTGASLEEAMALGNLAAGIVVRKSGTAVTSQSELIENLERLGLSD